MGSMLWGVAICNLFAKTHRNKIPGFRTAPLIASASLLVVLSNGAMAQDFGKLFTTPEERVYLDGLREKFLQRTELEGFNISEQFKPLLESGIQDQNVEFELSGFMNRKNGGRAVWLNGKALNESELPQNVAIVSRKGMNMLRFTTQEKVHYVKAGQTLNIETGQVRESFESKPETAIDGLTSSISEFFQKDQQSEKNDSDKPGKQAAKESVGIDDLIEALQTIQETKGE